MISWRSGVLGASLALGSTTAMAHFSHHPWFSEQNPGIDNFGIRLVRTLGR